MNIIDLPKKIAVFPLSNAVFFPKTVLPLNIFEERYIQLVIVCRIKDYLEWFNLKQKKKII